MNQKTKLLTNMWIFSTIIIILFAIIVLNEKKYILLEAKVEEKLKNYIDSNYQEIRKELHIGKINYQPGSHIYQIKLVNKKNKNLSFSISYQKKKILSTYQEDYVKGKSLLSFYKRKIEEEINDGKKLKTTLTFTKNLNSYTSDIKEELINGEIKSLPIYQLQTELKPASFDIDSISSSIKAYHQYITSLGYHPKAYTLHILLEDKKNSFEIKNLDSELINNHTEEIINGIIKKDNSIISRYNINYQYLY